MEFIEIDKLPKFLGGNCECEGGCLFKEPGPWNDYEIHGNGIRLKNRPEENKVEELDND